jgi:hypothetical protein
MERAGMSVFVHRHSKALKSYPFWSMRKKVALKPVGGYIVFSTTAIIHVASPSKKQHTKKFKYAAVSLNYVTFVFTPIHQ